MTRDERNKLLDDALKLGEKAVDGVRVNRPHVKSAGAIAYAAIKAALPVLRPDLVNEPRA